VSVSTPETPSDDGLAPENLRWSVQQRMEFIELRLFWDGSINRSHLIDQFSISVPQASADLSRYLQLAPDNLEYDASSKAYQATSHFKPRFAAPEARHYLAQLLLLADQGITSTASWLGVLPDNAVVPRVRRKMDANTLRPIVNAIHRKLGLYITYQSMNEPEPTSRWIDPHALVFDGHRWHVRAWCHKRSHFADFVLARVLEIGESRPASATSTLDREWNEVVEFKLAPLPTLTLAQRRAVEYDYGMENGSVSIPMRLCLTYYFERHHALDLDPKNLEPGRIQLCWINRDEIEEARAKKRQVKGDA
jgi:predicted DNA-binding transcriptional regulator YafY